MAVMALDQSDVIVLVLLAGAWALLVWMWWRLVFRKGGKKMEAVCLWCYDDFRVEFMRKYPDETQPPYEPDGYTFDLCEKHRFFRAQIGAETAPQIVETDGVRDEYAVEVEIGAWS